MELDEVSNTVHSNWKELNLGESAILKARIGWQGLTTSEYLDTGNYYLITGTDFKNGFIDWDNCVFVEKNRYDQDKNIQVQVGDVLVTKDGTIGKVAFVDKVPKPTTLNSGVFVIRPKNKAFDTKYFYYVLMSNHFADFLSRLTAGSTISHLYQKDFVHFNFTLPPLPEQKTIAQVLSDTDNLIQAIEQKLTKKRAIKQGAMQQLLTPKEDWVVKNYVDIFIKHQSKNFQINSKEYEENGKFQVVDQGKKIVVAYSNNDNKLFKIQEDGIIVFGDHTRIVKFIDFDFVVGADGTQLLSTKNVFLTKFIYYLLLNKEIPNTGYNRHFKYILEMKFAIPKTKQEQTEIATILSDMDAEIEQLEQKLSKYKMVKQGLMQNLLTGKIRLV